MKKQKKENNELQPHEVLADVPETEQVDPFLNILDLDTESEPTSGQLPLPMVRVSDNDVALVRIITATMLPVDTHFFQQDEFRGYLHCNGDSCALCLYGKKKSPQYLMPVMDINNQEVALLRITANKGAGALLPQIIPLVRQFEKDSTAATVVQVQRNGVRFHVSPIAAGPGLDYGDSLIRAFVARMASMTKAQQAEYFRASITSRPNAQIIEDFPKVAHVIQVRNPSIDLKTL